MKDGKSIKVLLVDDEERFRVATAATLKRRGFDVRAVVNGSEALKAVWRDDMDVVVLDIQMPGIDGHRALREIKRLKPDIEVIMLTGHGSLDSALEGWQDDVFTYLTKPCDIDTLAAIIGYAFAKRKGLKNSQLLDTGRA